MMKVCVVRVARRTQHVNYIEVLAQWGASTEDGGWWVPATDWRGGLVPTEDYQSLAAMLDAPDIVAQVVTPKGDWVDVPGPVFLDMLRDGEAAIPGIVWGEAV